VHFIRHTLRWTPPTKRLPAAPIFPKTPRLRSILRTLRAFCPAFIGLFGDYKLYI